MNISHGVNVEDKWRDQLVVDECCISDIIMKEKDRTNHISEHHDNADLYKTCCSCKIYKHSGNSSKRLNCFMRNYRSKERKKT